MIRDWPALTRTPAQTSAGFQVTEGARLGPSEAAGYHVASVFGATVAPWPPYLNGTDSYSRFGDAAILTVNSTPSTQITALAFSLGNVRSPAEFSSLYDRYRLDKVSTSEAMGSSGVKRNIFIWL